MKMLLTFKNRLVTKMIFSQQGNIIEQQIIKEILDKVCLKADELKESGIVSTASGSSWNDEIVKKYDKEIDFTKLEVELMQREVERLDREKKVTQDLLELCLKIRDAK